MMLPARRHVLRSALTTVCAASMAALATRGATAPPPREIEIVARRFSFTPNEIPLQVNERVVLVIRSLDFVHGFKVPDLHLRADLIPGKPTRIELRPREAGNLDFLCDNFCGDGHEGMHGRFVVSG